MKLLTFNPHAPFDIPPLSPVKAPVKGSEYQTLPTQTFLSPSASPIALPYRVVRAASPVVEAPGESLKFNEHAPSHSEKINNGLKSLLESVTQHKEMLLGKFVKLDERLREVEQREQLLEARERSLIGREEELIEGINALQRAEEELSALFRNA